MHSLTLGAILRACLKTAALVVGFLFFGAILTPPFQGARARARLRSCFANQKTLSGAIEMYNLDTKSTLWNGGLHRLDQEDWEILVKGGYLQSPLADPTGNSARPYDHYVQLGLTDRTTPEIFCLTHGKIQGSGTPREQLAAERVNDRPILDAASKYPPDWEQPDRGLLNLLAYLFMETFASLFPADWRRVKRCAWFGRGLALFTVVARAYRAELPWIYVVCTWTLGALCVGLGLLAVFEASRKIQLLLVPKLELKA